MATIGFYLENGLIVELGRLIKLGWSWIPSNQKNITKKEKDSVILEKIEVLNPIEVLKPKNLDSTNTLKLLHWSMESLGEGKGREQKLSISWLSWSVAWTKVKASTVAIKCLKPMQVKQGSSWQDLASQMQWEITWVTSRGNALVLVKAQRIL